MSGPKPRPMRGGFFFAIKDAIWPTDYYDVNINPQAFDDPFVDKTQWTIMRPGGTSFADFRLDQPVPGLWTFKAQQKARWFSLVFPATGLFVIVLSINAVLATPPAPFSAIIGALIIGGIFIAAGSYSLLTLERQTMFDFTAGEFRSQNSKQGMKWLGRGRAHCKLSDVYALQILPELVNGGEALTWVFELNLVLKDGSRVHVLGHGGFDEIRADAAALAEALNCPLWDCSVQVDEHGVN